MLITTPRQATKYQGQDESERNASKSTAFAEQRAWSILLVCQRDAQKFILSQAQKFLLIHARVAERVFHTTIGPVPTRAFLERGLRWRLRDGLSGQSEESMHGMRLDEGLACSAPVCWLLELQLSANHRHGRFLQREGHTNVLYGLVVRVTRLVSCKDLLY